MLMGLLKKKIFNRYRSTIHSKRQLRFLKRLYQLLTNGYPLIDALNMMIYDKDLKEQAELIKTNLISGKPIDESFRRAQFHSTITSYLYFVRMNGDLHASLKKCIAMFEQRVKNFEKLFRVMRYPAILLTIFIVLLIVIKQTILPTFLDLFETHHDTSSIIIHFILFIDFLSSLFIISVIFTIVFIFIWNKIKLKIPIEKRLQLYQRIPVFRSFVTAQTTFFFATHMSMLLKTGMSIKNILKKMSTQNTLPIISYYSSLMTEELKNGNHYLMLLRQLPFIEKQFADLFQKDSNKDQLERDLSAYSQMIAEKIEHNVMKMLAIIQPTFFIILGCFIIFIYGTLMWPMLELIKSV